MGIFGPGVGGGLLATAGALNGLGQGISEVGQQQQKVNLETKMNEMAQAREEAITRLQGSQASALEEKREGHEDTRAALERSTQSAIATNQIAHQEKEAETQRQFQAGESEKSRAQTEKLAKEKEASQERIGAGHDAARIGAVQARVPAAKPPPKEWTPKTVTLQAGMTKDPQTGAMVMAPGRQIQVMVHRDGTSLVQVKDRFLPLNNSAPDGLGVKPESLVRASPALVQELVSNPLGVTPAGTPLKDAFLNRYHYLPAQYMSAAQAARDQMNAKSAPQAGGGGSAAPAGNEDGPTPEQEDPAESEPDPQAPQ